MEIRKIDASEYETAFDLVWKVFLEYEAPDYEKEGVEEFYKSIHDETYVAELCIYAAFEKDEMVGVIATRSNGCHIALFFVDGQYHRQGIGRRLFQAASADCPSDKMTVNASPYAVAVYHKLGFVDTGAEKTVSGIRFTPMEVTL
ncbi:MAG: GNAT family N-acetyltransferase [Lachnospiraceae bacterium]